MPTVSSVARAITGLTDVVSLWIKGSELRRKSTLSRSIEQMFDLIEKDELTPKYFKHYKKRIRAHL